MKLACFWTNLRSERDATVVVVVFIGGVIAHVPQAAQSHGALVPESTGLPLNVGRSDVSHTVLHRFTPHRAVSL